MLVSLFVTKLYVSHLIVISERSNFEQKPELQSTLTPYSLTPPFNVSGTSKAPSKCSIRPHCHHGSRLPSISKPLFRELLNTGDRICCIYNSQPPIQCISEGSSVTGRAGKIDIRYCVSPWNSNTA